MNFLQQVQRPQPVAAAITGGDTNRFRALDLVLRDHVDDRVGGAGTPQHGARTANDLDALDFFERRDLILLLESMRDDAVLGVAVDEQQDVVVAVRNQSARPHHLPRGLCGRKKTWHSGEDVVDRAKPRPLDIPSRDHAHHRRRTRQLFLGARSRHHLTFIKSSIDSSETLSTKDCAPAPGKAVRDPRAGKNPAGRGRGQPPAARHGLQPIGAASQAVVLH